MDSDALFLGADSNDNWTMHFDEGCVSHFFDEALDYGTVSDFFQQEDSRDYLPIPSFLNPSNDIRVTPTVAEPKNGSANAHETICPPDLHLETAGERVETAIITTDTSSAVIQSPSLALHDGYVPALDETDINTDQGLNHDHASLKPADYRQGLTETHTRTARRRRKGQTAAARKDGSWKRTQIPKKSKSLLEEHFNDDPYPTFEAFSLLAQVTGLGSKIVRNWFSNKRARTDPSKGQGTGYEGAGLDSGNQEQMENPRACSPMSEISEANLEALRQHSPASSTASIERYLASPPDEDSVPVAAVEATIEDEAADKDVRGIRKWNLSTPPQLPSPKLSIVHANIARPTLPAVSTISSPHSGISANSHKSYDSRGSRKGRRRWTYYLSKPLEPSERIEKNFPNEGASPPLHEKYPADLKINAELPYYCTWPSCYATFRYRYEWARHEEAVHYCPYHWICSHSESPSGESRECFICHEKNTTAEHLVHRHFRGCKDKEREDRTFMRQDQLVQHIQRVHLNYSGGNHSIPRGLLSAWKTKNPSFKQEFLRCGFCGELLKSWSERQDHVFDHLETKVCKEAWWPERLPGPSGPKTITNEFRCLTCLKTFANFQSAVHTHTQCISWSCRYLHDSHAAFSTRYDPVGFKQSLCRLCGQVFDCSSTQHAATHNLRDCTQTVFLTKEDFLAHLREEHSAKILSADLDQEQLVEAWECLQVLDWRNDRALLQTFQKFEPESQCTSQPVRVSLIRPKGNIAHL